MVMDRQRSGWFSEGEIALARNLLIFFDGPEFLQKLEFRYQVWEVKSLSNILRFLH